MVTEQTVPARRFRVGGELCMHVMKSFICHEKVGSTPTKSGG